MKKVFLSAFLILLLFTAYEIGVSYSLFETKNDFYTKQNIGQWEIEVNNKSVNSSSNFDITDFIFTEQEGVRTGKMAPGKTGTFSISIKPGDTDVAFKYDIIIDKNKFTNDMFTLSEIIDTSGNSLILTNRDRYVDTSGNIVRDKFTYTGLYTLDDIALNQTRNIRITLMWVNNESNNGVDSLWGTSGEDVIIPITVHLEQYLGEPIEAYTGSIY